ncbi:MAG: T9SS type A sorting domain-containing protein [Rhodothermales bacterium]|nr:T9SS type A sorting domain-containing protein [Rhodothermales bacterium]
MRHEYAIRLWACLSLLLISWSSASAQEPCGPGTAVSELSTNDVRAVLTNNGSLMWTDPAEPSPVYEVPKGSGSNAINTVSLWFGGMVGNELRMSAGLYSDFELWPGPLDIEGQPAADCTPYDRIFNVSDDDIRQYDDTGIATPDMLDWPWHLGAPVHDGDGDPHNYDLIGGDRPHVHGDQTLWWILNDAGNRHLSTGTEPVGMEVRVTAFVSGSSDVWWVPYATLYRFELVYRGSQPLEDAFFGIFAETDLGNPDDDYIGSDSTRGLAFTYNGDNVDEGPFGYGSRPPALGIRLIDGPTVDGDGVDNDRDGETDELGERLGLKKVFSFERNASVQGLPKYAYEFYYYLQARYRDGTPMCSGWTINRGCPFHTEAANFIFPTDPPEYWSEENIYADGTPNEPGDRRLLLSTGPFRMDPGEYQEITAAILFVPGGPDRYEMIRWLHHAASHVRYLYPALSQFEIEQSEQYATPGPDNFALGIHPKPAAEHVTLEFEIPVAGHVQITVLNVLGRRVLVPVEGVYGSGRHWVDVNLLGLAAGVYTARIEAHNVSGARSFVLAGS